jgi:uncharacterized protein (DUF697 family)
LWNAIGALRILDNCGPIEAASQVARLLLNERSLPLAATKETKTAMPTKSTALTTNQKVHGIIHTAATAAAAVGAGLAQIPGSDAPVLVSIQTTMIMAIAKEYGVPVTKAAAADLLLTFTATAVGRGISQWLVGWIPGLGNVINASTAAALTEAVGWAADAYFGEQRAAA